MRYDVSTGLQPSRKRFCEAARTPEAILISNQDFKNQVSAETLEVFQVGIQEIEFARIASWNLRVESRAWRSDLNQCFFEIRAPRFCRLFASGKSKKSEGSNGSSRRFCKKEQSNYWRWDKPAFGIPWTVKQAKLDKRSIGEKIRTNELIEWAKMPIRTDAYTR